MTMHVAVILAIVGAGTIVTGALLAWAVSVAIRKSRENAARDLQAYQTVAAQRGWRYAERDDELAYLAPPCPAGEWHTLSRVEHAVTGSYRGRPLVAALFQFEFKSGWHSVSPQSEQLNRLHNEYDSVPGTRNEGPVHVRHAALQLPMPLPELRITPCLAIEKKVNSALGLGGWNSGNPAFDSRFDVETMNPQLAQDVLNPGMLAYLAEDPAANGWSFAISGDWLFLTKGAMSLTQLIEGADYLCGVYDRLPATIRPPGT